ncbi:CAMK/CAMKL/CHK1 protein kinase [Coprinopsis marcescibilis]|uniref:CAMK/CAMKL/CHK1 protein kinase n=1 Tax=Coprinopsis marcescibilis TaxID=230819 RepID=A0A5C3KUY0_COPMA|nr:CAMK/CAMKL/CHK1 protein kinase [Coprinopsis marcescibilis]
MPEYPKVTGYTLVDKIGGGGFSNVFKAIDFTHHRAAACKHIPLTLQTTDKERKTLDKEMRIHAALDHVHVLKFVNAVIVEVRHRELYWPGYYMLLELAGGGDLFDKIAPDRGVEDDTAHHFFGQLIAGMTYIHSQGVCHRDLKPENILLDAGGTLKISDYGLSAVYKLKDSGRTRTLTERCGSLPYVAPELANEVPYHAEPIDVWGCGVILFTMLVGNTPWDEPTTRSPEFRRYLDRTIFLEDPWNRIGERVLSLVCGMLEVDPARRLTLGQVAAHSWLVRPSQLLKKGPIVLAERLTNGLRENGDLDIAAPDLGQAMDVDGDEYGGPTNTNHTQFTQKLMLFSQTQAGTRYTPNLTRFYARLPPAQLLPLIQSALEGHGVRCKASGDNELLLRVGGFDKRKVRFKGWVEVERYSSRSDGDEDGDASGDSMGEDGDDGKVGFEGSFCSMARDEGNPISWRQLWKALVQSEGVKEWVLWR